VSFADVSHLLLTTGRLLLANGADTDDVQRSVARLAATLGAEEARVAVTSEYLILTLFEEGAFRTRIGHHIAAFGVNMAVVASVHGLLDECERAPLGSDELGRRLDAIERQPGCPPALVILLLGLTAGCLARLFGGDGAAVAVSWVAASLGMALRIRLGRAESNPYLVPFCAALLSGLVGAWGARWSQTATAEMCMVAPAMVIVPGVPLVNAVLDLVKNHITLGVGRLVQGGLCLLGISLGLGCAAALTRLVIPVELSTSTPPLPQVAACAALTALGYGALFNVPPRLVGGCVLTAAVSFTSRVMLLGAGLSLPLATLLAALTVGFLAPALARRWHAPAAVFAFPGVVAMVPGAFAFRASFGLLAWAGEGERVSLALVAGAGGLALQVMLVTGAIALGLALPQVVGRR
jgi:uncharacterized membrane protein YjjP (DUF1212 family)